MIADDDDDHIDMTFSVVALNIAWAVENHENQF